MPVYFAPSEGVSMTPEQDQMLRSLTADVAALKETVADLLELELAAAKVLSYISLQAKSLAGGEYAQSVALADGKISAAELKVIADRISGK